MRWLIERVERLGVWLSVAAVGCIMTIVGIDVAFRYLLNRPLHWAYDFVGLYLLPAALLPSISRAYAEGAHIALEFVTSRLPPRWFQAVSLVTRIASAVLFFLLCLYTCQKAWNSWQTDETQPGEYSWPTWPSLALIAAGFGLLFLRLVLCETPAPREPGPRKPPS